MKKTIFFFAILSVVLLVRFFIDNDGAQAVTARIEFTRQGMDLVLEQTREIEKIAVMNEHDQVLALITLGPGNRQKIPLFFPWEPNRNYHLAMIPTQGDGSVISARSPPARLEKVSFIPQAPNFSELANKIRILSVELPVDATGRIDPKARKGSLSYVLPSRWHEMTGTGLDTLRLDDEPFCYAGITLGNEGGEHVVVHIIGKVIDPASGALAPTFTPPPHKNFGLGYSYGVLAIAPQNTGKIVLPIYLDENSLVAGLYELRTEVSVLGANQAVATAETPMSLTTRNDQPLMITLLAMLLSILGAIWLLWRQEAVLARFSTKELVIISLFGTVTFVTVNLPQTVLWDIAHIVLGPFSFLVTGFFSQTLLFVLLMSLVAILPRPGAVTLMILVRMILNGFILGHFTPVLVLSYAALAACLEGALYGVGVTRRPWSGAKRKLLFLAVLCGLVDVLTTYVNFMAYMTLYRLFYADWYIYAVMAAGFAYTAVGAFVGMRLGMDLRRTAID